MDEKEILTGKYREMYRCMIAKDIDALSDLLDDSFVLIHMTGMRQPKPAFLRAVQNGTLNYYSEEPDNVRIELTQDTAMLVGQSRVNAAVFGGGRSTWRLQLRISLRRKNGEWLMTRAAASTY